MKHMNKKVVKRIFIGVGLYAVFVMAVIMLYPDTPHNMDWEDRQEFNKVQISKLELGQQKKHILELLGSPDITEAKRNEKLMGSPQKMNAQHYFLRMMN